MATASYDVAPAITAGVQGRLDFFHCASSVSVKVQEEDLYLHPDLVFLAHCNGDQNLFKDFLCFVHFLTDIKLPVWAFTETLCVRLCLELWRIRVSPSGLLMVEKCARE